MRFRTVGEVSELTGVTVRTLHHYDEIGLLEPSERTAAGYRLYSDADLVRLHSILNWRISPTTCATTFNDNDSPSGRIDFPR